MKPIRIFSRAAMLLLMMLLTATATWADPSGDWNGWVENNNIDWNDAAAKAAAIPQSDDGSTVYISTAEQLAYYAWAVNNDKQTSGSASGFYCGRTVELLADIDLSAHYWHPIGLNNNYYFSGFFHGNGHVITGMHVNEKPGNTNLYPGFGLFGYMKSRNAGTGTSCITDLVLKDFNVTASYSGNARNELYLGGLVGRCDDNTAITNCLLVNGSVSKNSLDTFSHIGKVVGGGSPSTATANYYHNVSVSVWDDRFDNYPQQTIGGEAEARTVALTVSGTHGSVALGGTVGVISQGIIYAPAGETVTLNATADAGYQLDLAATGLTLTSGQFTMPGNDDGTITATISINPDDFSVNNAGTEYTIHTAAGWGVFCDALQDNDTYNRFSGKTVKLGGDIGTAQEPVTRMAGSSHHDFCGTFDGQGYTLTVNYSTTENYAAPFAYVSETTPIGGNEVSHPAIRNLNVTGTVNATKEYASGLVGAFWGTLTIENCTSSVAVNTSNKYAAGFISNAQGNAIIRNCLSSATINSTVSGDGTHAGFIGVAGSVNLNIEGCAFTGSLLGTSTTSCAGFVGFGGTVTITNSIYAPAEVTVQNDNSATFARGNTPATTNSYYSAALGTAQGKALRTIEPGTNVTISNIALTGDETEYNVSGITAYSGGGLSRGGNLYYGSDDQVSLTLSNDAPAPGQGYQYGYAASAGTISGTTLTMPDANVTVNVALVPIDWAKVKDAGTKAKPYMIYNKDQLLLLAYRVNGTHGETCQTDGYSGKYFKLGKDIEFDPNDLTLDNGQSNYEAIGHGDDTDYYFNGDFDGDDNTVSGIRICKTGEDETDNFQGLFGQIGNSANIHHVHVTDASITGYIFIGGIVGWNKSGTISHCTVTESVITADDYYGTICGYNFNYGLSHNYYRHCTVNGTANATNVGCNQIDEDDDNEGAMPMYVAYLDKDGAQQRRFDYTELTGGAATTLAGGWYVAKGTINYTRCVTLNDDVNIILADGCTMNIGTEQERINSDNCIYAKDNDKSLTIYGQANQSGTLNCYGSGMNAVNVKNYIQHGGNVTIDATNAKVILLHGNDLTLTQGTLTVNADDVFNAIDFDESAYSTINVSGGTLSANGYAICGNLALSGTATATFTGYIEDDVTVANGYIFTDGTNYYSGTLTADEKNAISGQTLEPFEPTGVTLTKDGSGNISAAFDGTSQTTVNIPASITVKSVTYTRTFSENKASTVMLPFNYSCDGSEGGTFYHFVGVEKEGNTWVATMQEPNNEGSLTANTPYLFMPNSDLDELNLTIPNNGTVTLNTTGGGNCQTADAGSHWTFKGTYAYKEWIANGANAAEIGSVYGFAGVAKTGIAVGDFVRVKSGAKIRPTYAYLMWNDDANSAKRRGATEELPQSITVRLLDANGNITHIGEMDMDTGDVTFDGWYDLNGRRLDGKPTTKGIYMNNGKKVMIK